MRVLTEKSGRRDDKSAAKNYLFKWVSWSEILNEANKRLKEITLRGKSSLLFKVSAMQIDRRNAQNSLASESLVERLFCGARRRCTCPIAFLMSSIENDFENSLSLSRKIRNGEKSFM